MKYQILINQNTREKFFKGYQPGDVLKKQWEGDIDWEPSKPDVEFTLEAIFRIHNQDDRPDGQIGPSLSVGDVVILDDHSYAVQDFGFKPVRLQEAP